jgi:lipopolysaccharide transport system ATP-binding protein
MKPILEILNISKRYRIEHLSRTYPTFREKILQTFQRGAHETEEFWALKDVSFDINPGDSIGIIGRNGAGKSTLLKILSKITPPTNGKIISRGRIASLLEVGTGFHPELTGRENVFLNGSLLGMKRKEIDKKFDDIVDFSGVEKFLDTPLKHFSSGMQLRLAFAVAAFLDPEILIIDEVLAVGDIEFQKKCIGKIGEIGKSGRTILFVSHNFEIMQRVCEKGVLLDAGKTVQLGTMIECIETYKKRVNKLFDQNLSIRTDRKGSGKVTIDNINLINAKGVSCKAVFSGERIKFQFLFKNRKNVRGQFQFDVGLLTDDEKHISWFSTSVAKTSVNFINGGDLEIDLLIDKLPLMPGVFQLIVYCKVDDEVSDWVLNAFEFQVVAGDFYGTDKLNHPSFGHFLIEHSFTTIETG